MEVEKTILTVNNLRVSIPTRKGLVEAVRGISFAVKEKECLAIVGESGCGKSVSMLSLLGLMPDKSRVIADEIIFNNQTSSLQHLQTARGKAVCYIFQDPMSSLNPTMKIGWQIAEPLIVHQSRNKQSAWLEAVELMTQTGIQDAASKAHRYPFEFSGGMLQRVAIAMAIASKPRLLIADEPTTALDVTLQQQILDILKNLQQRYGLAIILITHDLGIVARTADNVGVMYAGQLVEYGSCQQVFREAAHPYTLSLRQALPGNNKSIRLKNIPGTPPELIHPPSACGFAPRCEHTMHICTQQQPPLFFENTHFCRCWLHDPRLKQQEIKNA